ncbi:MAG: hypothetical protein ACKOLA_04950 [Spartobacteria bacterium]
MNHGSPEPPRTTKEPPRAHALKIQTQTDQTMNQHSETKPCRDCKTPLSTEPVSFDWFGKIKTYPAPDICEDCEKRREEEKKENERIEKLEKIWREIAPPRYRKNDITRFPQQLQVALETFDPDSDMGIGIRGETGQCKTRAAFELLKRAHLAGYRVAATRAKEIADLAQNQWESRPDMRIMVNIISAEPHPTIGHSAQNRRELCKTCSWLLIDDIGKEKHTERNEVELYDILEARTSHCLPTIWTLNMTAAQFKRRNSKDRSTPMLRRLVEFSHVILLD